jgi:alpha-L-fucosidase
MHTFTGILDFERGREDRLTPYPWLTDTSVGPWFHHEGCGYRSLTNLVQIFVDIVSKNGCMLLNVGPRADGTIPEKAQEMLLGLGQWLNVNGEAIYGTRPWLAYGEGMTHSRGGMFSEQHDPVFTAKDIRFTTKGDTLYAFALAWPADGKLRIRLLANDAGKVTAVSLLGHSGELTWKQTADGLEVALPAKKPCQHAFALRISGDHLKPSPNGPLPPGTPTPGQDGNVMLWAEAAQLHGTQIVTQEQHGHRFIACWDIPTDWASWKIHFPAAKDYDVSVVCAAANGPADFVVELAGQKLTATAAKTPSWFNYQTLRLGQVSVPKGVAELTIRAKDAARWRPVNVREIKLQAR